MKSPMMIVNPELAKVAEMAVKSATKNGYSDLRVLKSAAGYYIGTQYEEYDGDGKLVWQEPGSRDSGYFRSEEDAAKELGQMLGGDLSKVRWEP